jgi:hypothetical protein
MKITEIQHKGEPFWLYWLGNATAIDDKYIKSIGIAWLFKENGKWNFKPRITGQQSLFFNSVFFVRFSLPFGVFISVRWSSSETAKAILQTGIGWKLNGRLGILLRVQSDETSARGVTGQNIGQARGFNYGPH